MPRQIIFSEREQAGVITDRFTKCAKFRLDPQRVGVVKLGDKRRESQHCSAQVDGNDFLMVRLHVLDDKLDNVHDLVSKHCQVGLSGKIVICQLTEDPGKESVSR